MALTNKIKSLASYGTLTDSRSEADLMAQSREQLTMDMTKSDNSIFKRPRGCYLSQAKAIALFCLVALALVAVGVVTYYSVKCADDTAAQRSSGGDDGSGGKTTSGKIKDVRLPTNVRPIYYKVDLIPYLEEAKNFTIDGNVWVDIEVMEETSKVTIHIKNITVAEGDVTISEIPEPEAVVRKARLTETVEKESLSIVKHEYDIPREFYNMTLDGSLEVGKFYRIHIPFTAMLDDSLGGFYRSTYTDKATNETRYLGVTQFEATDARRAFPCFDEPALKAKFEVSLARRTNMSSIANMDLRMSEPVEGMEGWVWDHYNKSVPMSTYVVAFVVSDFENRTSDPSLSKPTFRVWARKDAIDQAEYARDIGPKILTYYEEYFDIAFPLPKQDMIALPDFGAGAMENWGLITYRETAMLYDRNVSSDSNKVRVATVIAHELAHMWYGNLVTMSWWSDLWLNEGFASYVEYIGVNHVAPEWKMLDQFVTDEIHYVMGLDSLDSSHPISITVKHPDEISEIFDSISYSKGASIIRMMNHFLTEPVFRAGLANYLKKWKFNNTVQDNLWEALTEVAHLNRTLEQSVSVKDIMDSWTLQLGFPVLNVERQYPGREARFTQTKFQLIKNETMAKKYEDYSWWVPISYASKSYNSDFQKTQPSFWLKKGQKSATNPIQADKQDWLIVNVQETGYYRVNYDMKNWQLIIDQLKANHSEIHTVNKAQLMDDALNLARASLLSYDLTFNITQYLKDEEEYLPWEAFLNGFSFIQTMLSKSSSYGVFRMYMRNLLQKEYSRLGYEQNDSDPLLDKLHRINVLHFACGANLKECVDSAKTMFAEWVASPNPAVNPIPTNLRRLTYCTAIKKGGEKEWDFLWQRYLETNVASEKNTILSSLACSKETWILNRYLTWAITAGSGIRKQDAGTVMRGVANNDVGNYIAFNFIREKWMTIKKYLGEGLFGLASTIKAISSGLNTEFELMEMQKFRDRYKDDLGSATRAVDQSIETISSHIQWMKDNYPVISSWLEKATKESSESPSASSGNSEL